MRQIKRVLAFLLTIVLVAGSESFMLPNTILAEETSQSTAMEYETEDPASAAMLTEESSGQDETDAATSEAAEPAEDGSETADPEANGSEAEVPDAYDTGVEEAEDSGELLLNNEEGSDQNILFIPEEPVEADPEAFPLLSENEYAAIEDVEDNKRELREHLDEVEFCVPGVDFVEDRIIVEAQDDAQADRFAEAFGGELINFEYGLALIELNAEEDAEEVTVKDAVITSADPDVFLPAAWPDYLGTFDGEEDVEEENAGYTEPAELENIPDEEGFDSMYTDRYLNSSDPNYQWQHYMMQSEAAWRAGAFGQNIRVAVLDTGVINSHEDLVVANRGYYNFSTGQIVEGSATDLHGHGTHCIGAIGARLNGKGGAGIAPQAVMNAIRVSPESSPSHPDSFAVIAGIYKAVDAWNVNVISMSLSFKFFPMGMEEAVEYAYQKGVAVFCSSGNDYITQLAYPAACKHSIPVGAIDKGNTKADFSNQNSRVNYSGPGVDIYSTYYEGASSYTMMSGTSMATPCVAGAAAVILSSGKVTESGKKKVDQLIKIMDSTCVKSGVGKGTPDLSKLFKGGMTAAPAAPVSDTRSGTYGVETLPVNVSASAGTWIYYTTDNGPVTFKDGVVSSTGTLKHIESNTGTINITGAASVTLRMIAVYTDIAKTNMLASKEVTYTYKLTPLIRTLALSGPTSPVCVQRGGSVQLSAVCTPSYAYNKALNWEITGNPAGISVNGSGKVSVAKTSTAASFTVKATAKDGSGKNATINVTVKDSSPVSAIKAVPASVTLYDGETQTVNITTTLADKSIVNTADYVAWKPDDSGIATCSISGNTLTVTGVKAGKTNVTGIAKDGSGKKCTVKVTVNGKVKTITFSLAPQIARGKAATPAVASITPANAKSKALTWTLSAVPGSANPQTCGVSVNAKNGKITVGNNAITGTYKIRATAADGKGAYAEKSFTVITNAISSLIVDTASLNLFRTAGPNNVATSKTIPVTVNGGSAANVRAVSANEAILSASYNGSTGNLILSATGRATGKVNVTVESTDGSNLKKTIKVNVINPPTRLYLTNSGSHSEALEYGRIMKLIPTFVTECGKLDSDSTKLEWTSSSPSVISVNKNGLVKNVKKKWYNYYWYNYDYDEFMDLYSVTITARTTDGSNLSAEYRVIPNPKISRIDSYFDKDRPSCHVGDNAYLLFQPRVSRIYGSDFSAYPSSTAIISGPNGGVYGVFEHYMNCDALHLVAHKPGRYKIKVYRTDGSKLKVTRIWNVYP